MRAARPAPVSVLTSNRSARVDRGPLVRTSLGISSTNSTMSGLGFLQPQSPSPHATMEGIQGGMTAEGQPVSAFLKAAQPLCEPTQVLESLRFSLSGEALGARRRRDRGSRHMAVEILAEP